MTWTKGCKVRCFSPGIPWPLTSGKISPSENFIKVPNIVINTEINLQKKVIFMGDYLQAGDFSEEVFFTIFRLYF